MNKCRVSFLTVLFFAILCWTACDSIQQPKPYGYFRIDFPEQQYHLFQNEHFSFKYPEYATIIIDPQHTNNTNWFDISYPAYHATIHCSYHAVQNNFDTLTEDARAFVMKHIPKANSIEQILIDNDVTHVYGLIYDISGIGAASPCQFFLSDTITHFLRGALYFNVAPNNDSLAPVIHFIRQDIDTLVSSIKWK
jgi:gliding motility-associated lipoprotein GldD